MLLQKQFDLPTESRASAFSSSFQDLNDPFYGGEKPTYVHYVNIVCVNFPG